MSVKPKEGFGKQKRCMFNSMVFLKMVLENYKLILNSVFNKAISILDTITFVGLHIRRTDYFRHMTLRNLSIVDPEYFPKAMNIFREATKVI